MSDRDRCVVCGHFLGSHDGMPPFQCSLRGCGCAFYVPPVAATPSPGTAPTERADAQA